MSDDKKLSKSDHCDGEFFFNPGHPPHGKSLTQVLKWRFTSKPKKWPKFQQNKKDSQLSPLLSNYGCNLTYVNHATVYVQTPQVSFVTDPVWSERTSPFQWMGPRRSRPPGFPINDIPKLDFILLSHNHYDHMDENSLKFLA